MKIKEIYIDNYRNLSGLTINLLELCTSSGIIGKNKRRE